MNTFSKIDSVIINSMQKEIPLMKRPFKDIAESLSLSESDVLARITDLKDAGIITRFGPMYNIDRGGGLFVLCAMEVPLERFDEVTEMLNQIDEVAHNYERTHKLNMWFVVACESTNEANQIIAQIEEVVKLKVYAFNKEEEYCVNLFLPVRSEQIHE